MLALQNQTGQFLNLNLRPEKHGDENVPGADLKLSITAPSDILAEFHPSLRSLLFRAPEADEQDLVDQTHEAPSESRLRFGSRLHVIKWDAEIVGASLTVHYGTGGKSDIALDDVTVDSFSIEPMDGGSVVLTFRVKCNPDEKAVGKLSTLMGNEIEFSLVPPEDADTLREVA